jgi:hypothetical protein
MQIKTVDDLLTVLGPRYTSWPRDIAIISGLLVGVEISKDALQQDIYKRILLKMGEISYGHLFHNSATMSKGFSWCSTSLFDLALAGSNSSKLHVTRSGDVIGRWRVLSLGNIPRERYIWKERNGLINAAIRLAIVRKDKHELLIEPEVELVKRALLVTHTTKEKPK